MHSPSEVTGPTAFLEISVTEGTNTAQEKEAFIAAAFEELQHQLGHGQLLAPASYVIVREVSATNWGYGGQTQATRYHYLQSMPAIRQYY